MPAAVKVVTPKGTFDSIWSAAKAYNMTCQGLRVRMLKDPHNYYKADQNNVTQNGQSNKIELL